MDKSNNAPAQSANVVLEEVWYEGTDALQKGEGVCYNTNYGTAASADGRRHNRVARPSTSNNRAFAGVTAQYYSAKSTGQMIRIYCPGSRGVKIALGANTVIDTGYLTFQVGGGSGAGRFVKAGYKGRGSAYIRQTVADAVVTSSMVGAWSLATDGKTLTHSSATVLAGDKVYILGGEDEGTTKKITAGLYTVASVTSDTVCVLSTSAGIGDAALTCTGYIVRNNPTAQADLMDGEESGGIEFLSMPNAGGDNQPYMVGGISYVCGGLTLAADAECELAQETFPGAKKAFVCLGTMTTSDFVVDLVTAGIQIDGSSALAEVNAFDAAGDAAWFEFKGARWFCLDLAGGATQA